MSHFASMSMYDDYMTMDKMSHIIIDFGVKYTKIGYSQESEPREIIPSIPIYDYASYFKAHIENMTKGMILRKTSNEENSVVEPAKILSEVISNSNPEDERLPTIDKFKIQITHEISNKFEDFISNILFNILQVQKKKRERNYNCFLIFNFFSNIDDYVQLIINKLLDTQMISVIRVLNSSELPLYSTGLSSGIVINLGHLNSTIVPINHSTILKSHVKHVDITAVSLELELLKRLVHENCVSPIKYKAQKLETFVDLILPYLNELFVKSVACISKKLSLELEGNQAEKDKFKEDFNKVDNYNGIPAFAISLYTRITIGEKIFNNDEGKFDDYMSDNTTNLAESLLNTLLSLFCEDRVKLSCNIVLAGGLAMSFGLYKRLNDEIQYQLTNNVEYKSLLGIKDKINIHKVLFPRNCLAWIGSKF